MPQKLVMIKAKVSTFKSCVSEAFHHQLPSYEHFLLISNESISYCPGLLGIELLFSCSGFRMKIAVTAHWCFSCCRAVLTPAQTLLLLVLPCQPGGRGCTRGWEGTEPGQLAPVTKGVSHTVWLVSSWWPMVVTPLLVFFFSCPFLLFLIPFFSLPFPFVSCFLSKRVSFRLNVLLTALPFWFPSPHPARVLGMGAGPWCVVLSCFLGLNHNRYWYFYCSFS